MVRASQSTGIISITLGAGLGGLKASDREATPWMKRVVKSAEGRVDSSEEDAKEDQRERENEEEKDERRRGRRTVIAGAELGVARDHSGPNDQARKPGLLGLQDELLREPLGKTVGAGTKGLSLREGKAGGGVGGTRSGRGG